MQIGNNNVKELYLGSLPVSSIWLGGLKVWDRVPEYTYEIDNLTIHYLPYSASINSILPNGDNYACVVGRVKQYKNGVLNETWQTMKLDLSTNSYYVVNEGNKDLYFNVDEYGVTNMTSLSNPFYINVATSYKGTTGPSVQIAVTPNLLTATTVHERSCSATTNVEFLNYNQTSFTLYNQNKITYKKSFSSGEDLYSTTANEGYLFTTNPNNGISTLVTQIAPAGSATVNVGSVNSDTYPKIFPYRISHQNGVTSIDHWIYIMQKSSTNTSGLQLYWGSTKIGNGWTIETSTFFYLANNGHTASTTYTWECDDPWINITEIGGVFCFDNINSSTNATVTINDNKGNSCTFDIYGS